ncbi:SCO7613 C-terminal domain-containing membrane protein [Streptomyces sp. CBMA291]|uniref:SCO7613 C-terminal domain-containing membrane protein n=1 Tax=Streptomyces sp. CBMA291 TaxID=1930279 RepID=UPI0016614D8D|nr:hypothetical protein [Streptomyces sp. CBMA291]
MDTSLPPADELVLVDRELARLDARRSQLLARRAWLLQVLRPPVASAAPLPFAPVADSTPRGTQNVLLTLGGTLLTIAAVAFTLVSWGSMGIGGRATVLAAVTAAALAAPVVLSRKGLGSTAESVAALGLALTVLDAYALHRVALPGADGLGYAAAASAVLAGAWAAYGMGLPRLRGPLPAAMAAGQLPLPLGVLAAGGGPTAFAWAALVTAAADGAVASWNRPADSVRITAVSGATVLGGWALLMGGSLSLTAPWSGAALLLACTAVALRAVLRTPSLTLAGGLVAGVAVAAAFGGLLRAGLPSDWTVPGYVLCGLALASVWRAGVFGARLPDGIREGLAYAGGTVGALGLLWALPPVVTGALGPLGRRTEVWSGEHSAPLLPAHPGTALLVLAVSAAALMWVPRVWARRGGLVLTWGLLTAVPVTLGWGYAPTLVLLLLTAAGSLCGAVWPEALTRGLTRPDDGTAPEVATNGAAPDGTVGDGASPGTTAADVRTAGAAAQDGIAGVTAPGTAAHGGAPMGAAPGAGAPAADVVLGWTAFAGGLVSAVGAMALSLDVRGATFAVLGVVCALLVGVAVRAGDERRVVAACGAVLVAAGLVGAGAAACGVGARGTALALLLVPAATAYVGAKARPVALPVEITGGAVGLVAVGLSASRPAFHALVLALGGVIAAATALRPERRRFASWTAAALFLLAAWIRLGVWGVTAPEAYTLPVTVPALAVGFLRRRRDPEASSWTAYGPGLAVTLLPCLAAAWADPDWPRPLLLGVAALVATLLGARFRLQAPLLIGGAVLVLDGLHELAPFVVQAVGALPRWLPPALAGLLLLAVGATYEQRLRDARRLRDRVARMR